jgi:hypothetical protein
MGPVLLFLSVAVMMVWGWGGCRTVKRGNCAWLGSTVVMMRYLWMVNARGSPKTRA